ncbi:N/A [soil metagenome]
MTDLPETVVALLAERVAAFPDRPFASIYDRAGGVQRWSYLAAGARVAGIADWLTTYGLLKGDRLAVYLDDGDPGIWLYLACAANGVVPVPLGPSYSLGALDQLAKQCQVKAVVTTPGLVASVATLGLPVLCFADTPGAVTIGEAPTPDPIARLRDLAAAVTGDDIYMFQPTSGSTGIPKVVMRRHVTFPRAGCVIAAGLTPDSPPQAGLLVQALTHGGGHYCLAVILYVGGEICIPSAIDTDVPLTEVEALAPTYLYLAPRILRSLFAQHATKYGEAAAATPFCGPRLQWITIGGAPSDEAQLSELERRCVQVVEGYGATEISVIAVTVRGQRRAHAVGRVLPDIDVRLSDDGEVEVKSEYGMAGYLDAPELTRAAFTYDGYYSTGDLGSLDAEGFLRIHGRSRDVFNSAEGSNIYPTRIEEMLEGLPSIGQAILVGDVKPFITALLHVEGSEDSDEPLAPCDHAGLYATVRAEIETVNERLEAFERIRRFVLLPRPFPSEVYHPVGQSKIRRDRKASVARYLDLIDAMYAASSPYDC